MACGAITDTTIKRMHLSGLEVVRAPDIARMYYVYVLRSELDGKFYIGYTTNLEKRLRKHQYGEVLSTSPRRPLELIFYEGSKNMEDAKRRESYLKTSKGKSSLRMMLRDSLKELEKFK